MRLLLRFAMIVTLISCCGVLVAAQQTRTPVTTEDSAIERDETFELNITERRIVEQNFSASTAVELNPNQHQGLSLRVGVGVQAERIDVLLRNVFGRVRFRASLRPVLERINSRQLTVVE